MRKEIHDTANLFVFAQCKREGDKERGRQREWGRDREGSYRKGVRQRESGRQTERGELERGRQREGVGERLREGGNRGRGRERLREGEWRVRE